MKKLFGDTLRQIRLSRDMSQEEFAALLGTTKQVISRYETNQRTPKITTANEYAIRLNIPLNALLGDDSLCTKKEEPINFDELPEDVQRIIKLYDNASPEIQAAALAVLETPRQLPAALDVEAKKK